MSLQQGYLQGESPERQQVGEIVWINGPVARARGSRHVGMLEVVEVGEEHVIAEIIGWEGDVATLQIYEETSGLQPGAPVFGTGLPLSVELGPGLLQSIFDGIQRPLPVLERRSGAFIGRGVKVTPLYRKERWSFSPTAEVGVQVSGGSILGGAGGGVHDRRSHRTRGGGGWRAHDHHAAAVARPPPPTLRHPSLP